VVSAAAHARDAHAAPAERGEEQVKLAPSLDDRAIATRAEYLAQGHVPARGDLREDLAEAEFA
jgi:hypothetical protein